MQVKVSATGHLKRFIKEDRLISIEESITLNELKKICGIEANLVCGYTLNGRIAKGSDLLSDNDHVKFLMIVGAG